MVFNKDFDNSLSLMLLDENDINREKILYFLKIMPNKIYDTINKLIEDNSHLFYSDYKNSSPQIYMNFKDDEGYYYFFRCKILFGKLEISFDRNNEELNLSESFQLSLSPIKSEELLDICKFINIDVGRVKWSFDSLDYNVLSERQTMDTKYQMIGISDSKVMLISENCDGNFRRMKFDTQEILTNEISKGSLDLRRQHITRTRRKKR